MTPPSPSFLFRNASEIIRLASKASKQWVEPDAFLRYLPALEWIRKNRRSESKLLEVGSGDFGISAYTSIPVTKVDLSFSNIRRTENKIIATASSLPFQDRVFDLTCAIDLLEHVPKSERFKIISELIRVSKQSVIIAFPCSKAAYRSDLDILNEFKKPLPILEAHQEFAFPDAFEIKEWIGKLETFPISVQVNKSFNLHVRKWLTIRWLGEKKSARFWAERIIRNQILRKLLNFGDCYRQILWIELQDHNNR